MVGGRLFINMPTSQIAAIDAITGETLWVYNPKSYEEGTTTMTARWNQRGVAYWSDGPDREHERIFAGTGSGYLICVDAKTGEPCADFGNNGRLDLIADLPRSDRGDRAAVFGTVTTTRCWRHGYYAGVHLVVQHYQGSTSRLDARL